MTDQTLTTGRSLSEFTAQLASAQPAPGGGGAAALTLDPAQWQRIGNISRACDYLELSGRADFAAAFTDDLSFPQP